MMHLCLLRHAFLKLGKVVAVSLLALNLALKVRRANISFLAQLGISPNTPGRRTRQLEANLLADGCPDPLVVWGDNGRFTKQHPMR